MPNRPMRVLVVSDQQLWVRSLDTTLGPHGFSVLAVPTAKAAVEAVAVAQPDLLIIQSVLRDSSGPDLCARLRAEGIIDAVTPVLIITGGPCSREVRVAALRAGAWDCYSFPPDPELLVLKLRVYANARLRASQAREESHIDDATGLYSIVGTLRRATELALHARRYRRALGCAVIAVTSDPLPGSAGAAPASPALVRRVAAILRSAGRESDVIGHLTTAEFVVFAPDTDAVGIEVLARRLIEVVESVGRDPGAEPLPVRLQAGCYGVSNLAETAMDPADMVVRATLGFTTPLSEPSAVDAALVAPPPSPEAA